ncbi:MAG: phosphotransferase [Chloroflexota bacterium]|nr:phosphotransferase [Chloroflexota bacterium]MDE2948205.1 phosphotransferase [Chloroflexota bacterium]
MSEMRAIDIEDHAALLGYLRGRRWIPADERPTFRTLTGGVSNRTVWAQRRGGQDWVIKQALAKLRVQVDWFSAPERIQREAAGLRWLGGLIPEHVPAVVHQDSENNILVMTAIAQPHCNWKTALLAGRTSIDFAQSFGELLATIHNAAERHPQLEAEFAERRFFEELRLEPYYGYTASQMPAASAFLKRLIADTGRRRFALAHGDYSPKNVLIQRGRLIILDYEVIHFGDPAFDIGFSLTHFLSKAHHLPAHRVAFLDMARAYWQSYLANLSPPLHDAVRAYAVKHTLACLLARVAGRSPLEYLDADQRERQGRIVLDLIREGIGAAPDLIDAFGAKLGQMP